MAVNFVAVGDGFCVTDERSVDPPDTQHQQLPKDCLLLGCGELRADILGSGRFEQIFFAQSQGKVG